MSYVIDHQKITCWLIFDGFVKYSSAFVIIKVVNIFISVKFPELFNISLTCLCPPEK
jgi:hypothetical protein